MKHSKLLAILLALPIYNVNAQSLTLTTELEKTSYSLGVKVGENYRNQSIELNPESFYQGILTGFNNQPPILSVQEIDNLISNLQTQQIAKNKWKLEQLAKENLTKGQDFLAKNRQNKDVVVLPSGLQYKVLTPGKGTSPKLTDTVMVNYRGTLIDGTEFDSSYKHKKPIPLPINYLIKGCQEALTKMKPGDKWQLFIPADLAYGKQAAGTIIQPNSTLIFEIELLSIVNKGPKQEIK